MTIHGVPDVVLDVEAKAVAPDREKGGITFHGSRAMYLIQLYAKRILY